MDELLLPQGCTCSKLRKLTRAVSRLYDQHLAAVGLKATQYALLKLIASAPMPIAQLAERFGAERTTITRNLKPLQDAGWIAVAAGRDSRQRIVSITASGQERIDAAFHAWRRAQDAVDTLLGAGQVAALHQRLDDTYSRFAALTETTTDHPGTPS